MWCRILAIVYIFFFTFQLTAQQMEWFAIGNQWTYNYVSISSGDPNRITVVEEVDIEGQAAMMIVQDTSEQFNLVGIRLNGPGIDTFYVYEQNDSVFYYGDGSFHLLYDFNVALGDTITRYVPFDSRSGLPEVMSDSISYIVDSIGTLELNGGSVRGFHVIGFGSSSTNPNLGYAGGGLSEGWVYEYIGMTREYLFPYTSFLCDGACPSTILCFSPSDSIDDPISYTWQGLDCDNLPDNTRDFARPVTVSAYPNPAYASGPVTLDLGDLPVSGNELTVLIYDLSGRVVLSSKILVQKKATFNLPADLKAGMYLVNVRTRDAAVVSKLLVR